MREIFHFAAVATKEVVPVLLHLLTKQDEDAADDEYNISRAAYQCLQLYAQAVGGGVIQPVLAFVEANLRHEDWHNRDAAVSSNPGEREHVTIRGFAKAGEGRMPHDVRYEWPDPRIFERTRVLVLDAVTVQVPFP